MRLKGLLIDLAVGVLAVSLVLVLSLSTPLGIFNSKLTDIFLYAPVTPEFSPKTFVIKNTGNSALSTAEIESLLQQLNAKGAEHIVLVDYQSDAGGLPQQWPQNVYLASSGQNFVQPDEASIQLFELNATAGVYRSFSINQPDQSILTLLDQPKELTAAAQNPDYRRHFNFLIQPELLPNMSARQALNDGLIKELFNDKLVFIQVAPSRGYERLYIAESLQQNYVTYAELQALAAETLYHDYDLTVLPVIVTALLLLALYFFVFFLLQVLNSNGILLLEGFIIIVGLALAYVFFVGFHRVFPFGELVLTQLIVLLQFLFSEKRREGRILTSRAARLNARLSQKIQPTTFLQADDPWKNLHIFIDQHLHMRRSILLARVEQDHRVAAIHSLNCTIDDIDERRRDFQRAPYSSAIEAQRPYRLSDKRYFKDVTEQEVEYIVPLIFSGEVFGFWALTVEPDKKWRAAVFEQNLMSFSRELSELLYHRDRYVDWRNKEQRVFSRIVNLNYAVREQQQLDSAIELLERRVDLLQNVFSGNSSALVLYNLFGQVLTSNQKMDKLASTLDLKLFTISAHDLLIQLTGESSSEIKKLMLQITLHHRVVEWPISSPELESDYILRVRPIKREERGIQEVSPFLLAGILFEFIDVHLVQQVVERKRGLYRHYFNKLESHLEAMRIQAGQLENAIDKGNQQPLNDLKTLLDKVSHFSTETRHMLELQHHSNELLPVNPVQIIRGNLRKNNKSLKNKGIKVEYDWPQIPPLCMASVDQFDRLLNLIVNLLINDSDVAGGVIKISLNDYCDEDNQHRIEAYFANNGYGVPQEQFDNLNSQESVELFSESNELAKVLYFARQIEEWGASLNIATGLGKGFKIKLELSPFNAESPVTSTQVDGEL